MKQWKLVLVALLSLLLVCTCMSAMAECTHQIDGKTTYAWVVTTPATCTEDGVQSYKCSQCGDVSSTAKISKTGHTANGIWEVTVDPTCTTAGTRVQRCSVCTQVAKSETIAALGHNTVGVPFTVVKEPTCAETGLKAQVCARCGVSCNGTVLAKLTADSAHTWAIIDPAVAVTCTTDGKTALQQCTVCQAYKGGAAIKAPGHKASGTWIDDPARLATCTKSGFKIQLCTVCGAIANEKVQSAYGQKEGAWIVDKAATCTETGKRHTGCTVCTTVIKSETLAKIPHDVTGSPWVRVKEPTCAAAGLETRECIVCHGVGDSRAVAKLTADSAHTWTLIDEAIAPTHTAKGKTALYQCDVCKAYKGGAVVAELGHDKNLAWVDDPTATATCTKDGRKIKVCSCGVILDSKTQSKLGHKLGTAVVVPATCTATGTSTKSCERCDYKEVTKLPMIAHDVTGNPWEVKTPATCAAAGVEVRKCKVCLGDGETRAIPKIPCDVTKLVVIDPEIAVTCETDGKTATMQCPICKTITGGKAIKATGHATKEEVIKPATCTVDGEKRILCTNAWCNKGGVVSASVKIPAKGHQGVWKVLEKATPEKNGISIKVCKVCDLELDRKTVKYSEMLYNNTITSFGPCTRDLVGGSDWYRVTPIDLSVEGTFTYPLVASNKYTVGTATVVIANGTLTVTYDLNAAQIMVNSEALIIYPNLAALKNPTPATAGTYTFGAPIDIAATFGEDTKVIISLFLKADYNEIGAGVYSFKADEAQIAAMKAIID